MATEDFFNQMAMNSTFKRSFLDNMVELEGIGFWDLNLQTMDLHFSPQIYTMLGYEPKEAGIKYETWMDLMHPGDKASVMPLVKKAVRNQERYSVDFRLRCKNGDYKWISGRAKSYEIDQEGDIHHVMGVHVDIDEMKKNELSLQKTQRELEEKQAKLQERNLEFSCIFKVTEIVRNSSLSIGEMLQEIARVIPQAFPKPEFTHARICYEGHCFKSEYFQQAPSVLSCDITFHGNKVGTFEVFSEQALSEIDKKRQFIQELGTGLTRTVERIRAEKELAESEHKFRTLFETMAEGVVYHDKAARIISANPAAEWILACSIEEMQGRTSEDPKWQAIDEDGRPFPGEDHPVMVALRTREPVHGKIMGVYNQREEKYHWIKVNAIPQFHSDEDDPFQVYASFEDITREYEANIRLQETNDEIETMNKELRESMEEAKKADKAKTEFLATMSHELRTPLNGAIGFSEILRKTALDEQQQEFLDIVIRSANNLLAIISDILDFSRIDSNKLRLKPEKVDIRKLVDHTLDVIQWQADEKDLRLIKEIDNALPGVVALDPLRFNQVLLNLLTNAVKFTERGSITVTVSKKQIDREQKTVKLYFSVKDTGIGVPQAYQKRIFDPFSQRDMSNTRKYGGTGLGLAISKQLLVKMGSSLQLTSTPEKGSDFYFDLVLPYYDETSSAKQTENKPLAERNTSPSSLAGKKILITEDDPINMKLAKTALSRFSEDLILIEAKDGQEAYEQYRTQKPDLILMDIIIPKLDGYQATTMIRQHDTQIPIVALTAKALKEDREACLKAGMDDYISKPLFLDQLKRILTKYL